MIELNGMELTIEQVIAVARHNEQVRISEPAKQKIDRARAYVDEKLAQKAVIYGLTTGFGKFSDTFVPEQETAALQRNLIISHACGMGAPLPREVVRGAMLLRCNALARGNSGIRLSTLETLLAMLNRGVHPVVPEKGSLGASGDLAPLAHIVLVMLGEGEAEYQGAVMPGRQAMESAGISPVELAAKEGLALINGTQIMAAIACGVVYDAVQLAKTADMLEKTVDIDRLFAIAEGASELPDSDILTTTDRASELPEDSTLEKDSYGKQKVHLQKSGKRPVIAVARDEAFCFYYEDNLKALEKAGAEIVFFSPLHDGSVPKEADGLLLPGGYPELYAKELSENKTMLADIREKAELAMPIVAECGGFMYLHQTMEDTEHHVYEMAGVVPGDCFYTGKLVRFGYIELTEKESNFLPENGSIKGHEFHYFDSTANGDDCVALKPVSGKKYDCVFDKNTCFVGFPHLYYPSAPQFAENFVKKAKNYADRSEVNS